jgi:opacity protein-like surface antigen
MPRTKTQWLACAAGIFLALPASAQSLEQGDWETSLGIGFLNSTDADFKGGTTASFDSDSGFRGAVDYSLTDALQIGGSFSIGQRSYDASIAGDEPGESFRAKGDLDYSSLLVTGTFNLLDGPFRPFVTAGIGWSWIDTNIATEPPEVGCWWDPWYGYICTSWVNTRTLDGLTYQVGVGARYDFSDNFAIHASYRIDWIDIEQADGTPDFDGFDLSLGFKF